MGAFTFAAVNYSAGKESEQIPAQLVTSNYFSLLGTQPALGRGFLPEEEAKATPVAVLSQGFWQRSLGSDPQIVGKTITLNRTPFTIVGVAPKNFSGTLLGGGPSVWLPISMHLVAQPGFDWYDTRRGLFLFASAASSRARRSNRRGRTCARSLPISSSTFPVDNKGRSATAVPLLDARLNPNGQGPNLVVQLSSILMVVVGIVLLIACINIANLLLARASKRRREIAIRLALGAKRSRLISQLLTESVMLSLLGGAAGLLIALLDVERHRGRRRLPLPFPVDDTLALDARVLVFTAALAVLTGVLFGLAPALQASRADVVPVLKNETRALRRGRTRPSRLLEPPSDPRRPPGGRRPSSHSLRPACSCAAQRARRPSTPGSRRRACWSWTSTWVGKATHPSVAASSTISWSSASARSPAYSGAAIAQSAPLAGGILPQRLPGRRRHHHPRPHPGAGEHRRPRLLPDDRHPARARPRLHPRRRVTARQRSSSSTRRWRSSSGQAKKRIGKRFKFFGDADYTDGDRRRPRQQVQRRRRGADCRSSISRSCRTTRRQARCTCDRPATPRRSRRRFGARCSSSIRRCRSSTSARSRNRSADSLAAAADERDLAGRRSACWRCCSRRSASTASRATRSRSARARSACAWRSARSRRACSRLVLGPRHDAGRRRRASRLGLVRRVCRSSFTQALFAGRQRRAIR